MSFYVVVRGPLGSGKTTVARRLARSLRGERVSIDAILDAHDLERWERGYISESSFRRANTFAIERARRAMRAGRPAILDGNFYWRSVLADLERRLSASHVVLTLDAPISVCIRRDAGRPSPHGPEAVREVYRKTTSFDYGRRLDARGSIDSVVRRALAAVRTGLRPGGQALRAAAGLRAQIRRRPADRARPCTKPSSHRARRRRRPPRSSRRAS